MDIPREIRKLSGTRRVGDVMVDCRTTITTRPAIIDFQELVDATVVESDDYYNETPWDHQDGYEHTWISNRDIRYTDREEARGWCYSNTHRDSGVVVLAESASQDEYKYYRDNGMSKQAAAECVAAFRRRILDQMVDWIRYGWTWWSVRCEYADHSSSCGGIDDLEYAETEISREVAFEVAAQLEVAGYTITNKPTPEYDVRKIAHAKFQRQIHLDCWNTAKGGV